MLVVDSESDLRPVVEAVVREVLSQRADAEAKLGGRLGFTEPEAAALLGVKQHVLRDARARGEISARRVGRRYIYSRAALLDFLEAER
ncbi:MAG: hypothetical protein A2V70_18185 [Planctomycetes bacterium RBG_13_63_9]|nr:MAG: hypothetical protein A2V70_18185 [Planctomycetes bacterium RBG_13_63_9]